MSASSSSASTAAASSKKTLTSEHLPPIRVPRKNLIAPTPQMKTRRLGIETLGAPREFQELPPLAIKAINHYQIRAEVAEKSVAEEQESLFAMQLVITKQQRIIEKLKSKINFLENSLREVSQIAANVTMPQIKREPEEFKS